MKHAEVDSTPPAFTWRSVGIPTVEGRTEQCEHWASVDAAPATRLRSTPHHRRLMPTCPCPDPQRLDGWVEEHPNRATGRTGSTGPTAERTAGSELLVETVPLELLAVTSSMRSTLVVVDNHAASQDSGCLRWEEGPAGTGDGEYRPRLSRWLCATHSERTPSSGRPRRGARATPTFAKKSLHCDCSGVLFRPHSGCSCLLGAAAHEAGRGAATTDRHEPVVA